MSLILQVVIFAVFIGMGVLILIFVMSRGRRPRSVLLASVAGRWNGRLIEGGLIAGDLIEINVDDVPGEITFSEGPREEWSSSGWTRIRFSCRMPQQLRVLPEQVLDTQVRRFLGAKEVPFDDPAFDARFWVESSDPAWARSVLLPDVRREFIKLQWSPQGPFADRLLLDLGPSGLHLRVSRVLVDSQDLLGGFVELAITLLRRSRVPSIPAGVLLESVPTQPGSTCPVCGHAVEAGIPCPRCRTPHHEDCWAYAGGCAIFGCEARARKVA